MSAPNPGSKLRYVWIVGALAALAIVLSPISPLSLFQPKPQSQAAGNVNSTSAPLSAADATPPPQPTNMTDADLALCSSLPTSVAQTIGGPSANVTTMPHTQKVASNLLAGEACNRLSLLHEGVPV